MSRTVNGGRFTGRVVCIIRRHRWSDWQPATRLLKKTRECERCHKREVVWLRRASPSGDPLEGEDRGRSRREPFSAAAWSHDIERELDEIWEEPTRRAARADRPRPRQQSRNLSKATFVSAAVGRWFIWAIKALGGVIVRGLERLEPAGRSGFRWTSSALRSAIVWVAGVIRSMPGWSIRVLAAAREWIGRGGIAFLQAVRRGRIACRPHLRYARYLARHKWFVFRAGLKTGAPLWRLVIHDWSKLTPAEWGPYARRLESGHPGISVADDHAPDFMRAWLHHQHRNPHHWQAWILRQDDGEPRTLEMPEHFAREMVADWMGTGRTDTGRWQAREWYQNGAGEAMDLHPATRDLAERLLREANGDRNHSEGAAGEGH